MTSPAAISTNATRSGAAAPSGVRGSANLRNDDAFLRAERHSRRVRLLKLSLPTLGGLLALGFLVFSYALTPPSIGIDLAGSAVQDGKLVMASPKLEGFTEDNLPYSMTAARAIQDFENTAVITLEDISAKLPVEEDNFAVISASGGVYDRDKNTLEVTSKMTVTTTDGMSARLDTAFIDLASGNLKTTKPVEIDLEGTHIAADSMSVSEGGKVLVFENRVRMEIQPEKLKTAQNNAGGGDARN